jgi:hypothetical protein
MQDLHAALSRLGLTPSRARVVSPKQNTTAALPSDVLPERDIVHVTAPSNERECGEEHALTTGMLRGFKSKRTFRVLASPSSSEDSGTDDIRRSQLDRTASVDQHCGNPASPAHTEAPVSVAAPTAPAETLELFTSPSTSTAVLGTSGRLHEQGLLSPGSAYADAEGDSSMPVPTGKSIAECISASNSTLNVQHLQQPEGV